MTQESVEDSNKGLGSVQGGGGMVLNILREGGMFQESAQDTGLGNVEGRGNVQESVEDTALGNVEGRGNVQESFVDKGKVY